MFHKVAWQHMQRMVGFLITGLLQIYEGIFLWIIVVNRLRFHRIMAMSLWHHFFGPPSKSPHCARSPRSYDQSSSADYKGVMSMKPDEASVLCVPLRWVRLFVSGSAWYFARLLLSSACSRITASSKPPVYGAEWRTDSATYKLHVHNFCSICIHPG